MNIICRMLLGLGLTGALALFAHRSFEERASRTI
jgi:hypothetical protein